MSSHSTVLQKTLQGAKAGGRLGLVGGMAGWHLLIGARTHWDGQTPMVAVPLGLLTGLAGAVGGGILGLCSDEESIENWDRTGKTIAEMVAAAILAASGVERKTEAED